MRIELLFVILMGGLTFSWVLPMAQAEIIGAHVTKIITDHVEPGYASVAFSVCTGNTPLTFPEILVSSESEKKSIVIERYIPKNTCLGETVKIKVNDFSSIEAELSTPIGQIDLDQFTRDTDGTVMFQGMSLNGKVMVEASSTLPVTGESSKIKLEFLDTYRNPIQHVNYDLRIRQNDVVVLEESSAHTHTGVQYHKTPTLKSDSALDLELELLGIGLPEENLDWEGPKGQIILFRAIPEFGPMSIFILLATISAVAVLGIKNRLQIISK